MSGILDVLNPVKLITDAAAGIIGKFVTDPNEKAQLQNQIANAQIELQQKAMEYDAAFVEAQKSVIIAEATGKSWMQNNWRPVLMFIFMAILTNNFILAPYIKAFGGNVVLLEIPTQMWALLTVGVGGYIGARTYEKTKDKD